MSSCKIRPMTPEDLTQVCRIENETFSEPWSRNGFLSSLSSGDTLYLVALHDDAVVGYCGLLQSFEEADITNVAVASAYRRQGIARRMLEQLMDMGSIRGIRRFTLEVRAGNTTAIHLYETLGFAAAGIRKRFYSRPEEDALIMWTGMDEVSV